MPLLTDLLHAPFRMQPGLRRVVPGASLLRPLAPDTAVFNRKLEVLRWHADHALVSAPGFDATTALQALATQAMADGTPGVSFDGRSVHAHALGLAAPLAGGGVQRLSGAHAGAAAALAGLPLQWHAAALLCLVLHADFAVVDGALGTVPWMAVCLPSHWDPAAKVGHHFTAIHAPVPDNTTLLAAGHHLMRLVCEPQRWERFVWTLTPDAAYDRHPQRAAALQWPAQAAPQEIAHAAWLRTEHQTFIAVPAQQQAVFTIDVEMQPLTQALTQPGDAQLMHAALASMSDAVLAYRDMAPARDRLLAWLARRAAA